MRFRKRVIVLLCTGNRFSRIFHLNHLIMLSKTFAKSEKSLTETKNTHQKYLSESFFNVLNNNKMEIEFREIKKATRLSSF